MLHVRVGCVVHRYICGRVDVGEILSIISPTSGHKKRVEVAYRSGRRKFITLSRCRFQLALAVINKALLPWGKVCSWVECYSRDSCRFHNISRLGEGGVAGGQDWSSMSGATLCNKCYMRFYRNGSLELPYRG
jgi:hypothetical protein